MLAYVGVALVLQAVLCVAGDLLLEPFLHTHGLSRPSLEDRHIQDITVSTRERIITQQCSGHATKQSF
jgi:hypothetical protein